MIFAKRKRRIVRLLVVEDEPLVAFDAEHFLTDADYVIVATLDRVSAATALLDDGASIDLVLVDVNLTDGSGIDVARAARAHGVDVMFVTGQCPSEAMELAAGCLAKPYAPRSLLAAIEAIETVKAGGTPKRLPPGFTLFAGPDRPAAA